MAWNRKCPFNIIISNFRNANASPYVIKVQDKILQQGSSTSSHLSDSTKKQTLVQPTV